MADKFIDLPFTLNNMDIYFSRNAVTNALRNKIPLFKGTFLDVGCGKMPYKTLVTSHRKVTQYIGLDLESAYDYGGEKADIFWTPEGKIPLENNTINAAMATEVLEHCPDPQAIVDEIHRVLEKDGIFFLTVPFIWNLHEVPYDEHRYTPFALQRILQNAGFQDIEIKAHGGWNASLALMLGLWCRRYWKNNILKFGFSFCLFPIIWLLYKTDKAPFPFKESDMITGLYAIAKK